MEKSRQYLNAYKAADKTAHKDEARGMVLKMSLLQIFLRLGQHAIQGHEELYVTLSAVEPQSEQSGRTMTPKLKLSEQARNVLLSWIRKFLLPGNSRTTTSTQMMAAPRTQATQQSPKPLAEYSAEAKGHAAQAAEVAPTDAAHDAHDPPSQIVINSRVGHCGCD